MENLGEILRRLAATRQTSNGDVERRSHNGGLERVTSCGICQDRGWFTADVPAGHNDFGQMNTCQCQQARMKESRSARLVRYSNLGSLTRFTFEALDPLGRANDAESRTMFGDAFRTSVSYADNVEGWLVITGPNGSGKTHLAAAIANRCIERGHVAFFAHVPDLLDHLRAAFAPDADLSHSELFEQVRNAPLLILDGIGSQSTTPWAQEKLQQIFNHRCNARLPTVLTTTAAIGELDPYMSSRLRSPDLSRVVQTRRDESVTPHRLGRIEDQMLRRMTFETFDVRGNNSNDRQRASLEGAFNSARNFAADPDGWLTLFGETGVGKTHLAVAIAVERMKEGQPAFFAFVPELLDYLRDTFTPENRFAYSEVFDEIKNTPLLILDDLGQEHSSPWAHEKLYQIIVHRHNARLPTVITTMEDFSQKRGPIGSRVQDYSVGDPVRIDARDFRVREARR